MPRDAPVETAASPGGRGAAFARASALAHPLRMRHLFSPVAFLTALGLALALVLAALRVRADETGDHPACIQVSGDSRYGAVGYDHVVTVRNGCDRAAVCSVTTNVNPQPASLRVTAGASADIVMWRGSPSREFSPRADCTLLGGTARGG